MKRFFCIVISAALLITAALCGCGNHETSKAAQSNQPATEAATTALTSPADSTAATNAAATGLNRALFGSNGGFKTYGDSSLTGIDVSSYSGNIDWQRVKAAGVSFVMVRLGGRGYGDEGAIYADDKATELIAGAKNAGLKTGGYFFSQAITEAEAMEEAQYIKNLLGDVTLDYPIAFDLETIENDAARTDNLTVAQATACAKAFCESVKSFGTPMIYAKSDVLTQKYDLSQLNGYDIWYSEYADYPTAYCPIAMWQYSESGTVDGVEGAVDLNLRFAE